MVVKKRNSISGKLVLLFSLSIAILITVLTSVICFRLKVECKTNFASEWNSTLTAVGNTVTMFINNTQNTVLSLCGDPRVRTTDDTLHNYAEDEGSVKISEINQSPKEKELAKIFKNVYDSHPEFLEVYMGTKWGGYATSFEGEMSGGYDPRLRDWYKETLNGYGKPIVTKAYQSTIGDMVLSVCNGVYSERNIFLGNVGIEITLNTVTDLVKETKVGETGFIMAIQSDGVILVDSKHSTFVSKTLEATYVEDFKTLANTPSGTLKIEMDGKTWYAQVKTMHYPTWKLVAFMEEEEVLKEYLYVSKTMIVLGCALLLVFAIGTALFALKLLKPIPAIMGMIEKISQGDFTSKLKIKTKDEFYVMAEQFNMAVDNISAAMASVHSSTAQVLSAEDALVSNMNETATSINHIHKNLDEVNAKTQTQAASVSETTTAVEEIMGSIGNLNSSIERQSLRLQESSASVQKMLDSMESISDTLRDNVALIDSLFEKTTKGQEKVYETAQVTEKIAQESENLLEASNVIQNIANNTNLLAMNASIEAAHAGEAGKGFAVVSDEIRKLAQDSDSQGKRIAEVIQESLDTIKSLTVAKKEEEDVFNEIYKMAETVLQKQKIVIEAITEISSGNREILTGINELSNVTAEVKLGSKEMLQGSEVVSTEMTKLNELSNEINDRMTAMSNNVMQINAALDEVGSISKLCTESMTDLSNKIKKFKVSEE